MPEVLERSKPRKKRKKLKARKGVNAQVVYEPPSLAGAISLFLGLAGVFCVAVQLLVRFQASVTPGSAAVESKFLPYLSKGQLLPGVVGLLLALGCLCFSRRRKWNGYLGLVLSAAVVTAWLVLGNHQVKW